MNRYYLTYLTFCNGLVEFVATQFLTHILDKFIEKTKNSKKTMKTPKKMHFDIFASF